MAEFDAPNMAATPSLTAGGSLGINVMPQSPPTPVPVNPQIDQQRQAIEAELGQSSQAAEQATAANIRASQIQKQKAEALAPLRDAYGKANAQPLPQQPETKKPPPAPTWEDSQKQSGDQLYLTAALFLGSLAGAMTRRPLTNALAGFTGVLQGYAEGKKDLFDRSMKQWEAETKAAVEANKEANDSYLRILKSRELDLEQKAQAIQIAAAHYDDQAMAQLAEGKQWEAIGHMHDQQVRNREMLLKGYEKGSVEMAEKNADKYVQSEQGQRKVKALVEGDLPFPSQNSRNPLVFYENRALIDAALSQGGNANRYQEKRTEATTRARAAANREVGLEIPIRNAQALIPDLIKASQAVPRTTWLSVNKLQEKGLEQVSDPAMRRFLTLNMDFASQFARTMNPMGVMRVDDREKALQMTQTADSAATYMENLKTIDTIFRRELQAIDDQKAGRPLPGVYWPVAEPAISVTGPGGVISRGAETLGGAVAPEVRPGMPAPGAPMPGTTPPPPGYNRGTGLSGRSPLEVLRQLYPGATVTPQ